MNREIQSVVSTADTRTEALDDAEIAADLAKPGIDFRALKKRSVTVYVILPPDMMERHGRWLRMLISSALRGVMRPREPGEKRVFFFMDEFAALGHLAIIETTWALVRTYQDEPGHIAYIFQYDVTCWLKRATLGYRRGILRDRKPSTAQDS